MTDYVREALFFSERLQPHFERVDLRKIFTDVQEQTLSVAAQRQVTVRLPTQAAISLVADRVLLQRMLGNLVRNAIEACEPGGEVRLLGSEPHQGCVRIQVIDDGCGIRPKDLPRIFDAYFTTKQFGNDVRGFGLGLAITEKIVHLHQGTISVHSETGLHTTMTVEIPATQSARDADPYDRFPNRPLHFVNAP
jgi:signal transduction histidine kinase